MAGPNTPPLSDCFHAVARRRAECGAALVEGVIVIPLMILFFFGAYDLGRALSQYFLLSRMTYEATRVATEQRGLDCPVPTAGPDAPICVETPVPSVGSSGLCGTGNATTNKPGHNLLHGKIGTLISGQSSRLLGVVNYSTVCRRGEAHADSNGVLIPGNLTTEVTLSMTYRSSNLFFIPDIPLSVTLVGPYLLNAD